jgi:REP element-mobilizing transposase RayT
MTATLAYFITFHTYGTWLHGDLRGSHNHCPRGDAANPSMPRLEFAMAQRMKADPVRLDEGERRLVEGTIHSVCTYRRWGVHASWAGAEHVHTVIAAPPSVAPERVMNDLKAWCSRRLFERGSRARGARVWSRHGSTRYLWTLDAVAQAVRYVGEHQGGGVGRPEPQGRHR